MLIKAFFLYKITKMNIKTIPSTLEEELASKIMDVCVALEVRIV